MPTETRDRTTPVYDEGTGQRLATHETTRLVPSPIRSWLPYLLATLIFFMGWISPRPPWLIQLVPSLNQELVREGFELVEKPYAVRVTRRYTNQEGSPYDQPMVNVTIPVRWTGTMEAKTSFFAEVLGPEGTLQRVGPFPGIPNGLDVSPWTTGTTVKVRLYIAERLTDDPSARFSESEWYEVEMP